MENSQHSPPQVASYTSSPLDIYHGNPLIEALPPIRSQKEVVRLLRSEPEILPEHRELPSTYRKHLLTNLLTFYEPVRETLDLEEKFGRIIRAGYVDRNPLGSAGGVIVREGENGDLKLGTVAGEDLPAPDRRASDLSQTMIGPSGMGKTTTTERILSSYPQVIRHRSYEGHPLPLTQVVHLKLDCPSEATVKGLCIEFFASIDRLIGTEYSDVHGRPRLNVQSMMLGMANVANLHALGVLVIDEIQFLAGKNNAGSPARKLLNFFTRLTNTVGIPLFMIGTPKARDILGREFRIARRGVGMGPTHWERWRKGDAYTRFCTRAWKFQYLQNVPPISDEMVDTLYDETQGITHLTVTALQLAQARALDHGYEELNPSLIRSAARDGFRELRHSLDALRDQNLPYLIEQEDLEPDPKNETKATKPVQKNGKSTKGKGKAPKKRAKAVGETNLLLEVVNEGKEEGLDAAESLRNAGLLGLPLPAA